MIWLAKWLINHVIKKLNSHFFKTKTPKLMADRVNAMYNITLLLSWDKAGSAPAKNWKLIGGGARKLKTRITPCLVGAQLPKSCYSTCHIECLRPVHGADRKSVV